MLRNLHVKNLALIEEEDIDFEKGFNVLTGETGAGKSIVLGSVNLALGAKLNSDVIRTGKEYALVELSFSLNENEIKKVKEMDLYPEEDGSVVIQRKIMPGKSVCRMNGETISVSQLRELSGVLLDMYGQHEHQGLLKTATYEKMLDAYAGEEVSGYIEGLKKDIAEYKELINELETNNTDTDVRNREIDLLKFEIEQIENAALKEGEDEELEKRYRFLNNAKKIKELVYEAHAMSGYENSEAAGSLIGNAVSRMQSVKALDEDAQELYDEIVEIEGLLSDFSRALSSYEDRLSFDEEEFFEIEERLNVINTLKDRFGPTLKDVLDNLEKKQEKLKILVNFEDYLSDLTAKIESLKHSMKSKCAAVSSLRTSAAPLLCKELTEQMKDLNFNDVRLNINIVPNEEKITESGYDDIEFLIRLNPGEDMRPIVEVASGGELSRLMLAIKSVFATKDEVSTLIFDEIDTGISGRTASMVANKMAALSKNHQLICITHLPQIAAMADEHFLIEKDVTDGRTVTNITSLDEEGTIMELCRMLSGDDNGESAILNARELRAKAKEKKG